MYGMANFCSDRRSDPSACDAILQHTSWPAAVLESGSPVRLCSLTHPFVYDCGTAVMQKINNGISQWGSLEPAEPKIR